MIDVEVSVIVETVQVEGTVALVRVAGELDLATSPTLYDHLVDLIEDGRHRLVLDFSEVSFCDCIGVATLVRVLKRVRQHHGTVGLVGLRRNVRKVFAICHLTSVFPLFDTVGEAVACIHAVGGE